MSLFVESYGPLSSEGGRYPYLLRHLGKMTSMRDVSLLEQSLLKTLGSNLGVLDCSLFKTDEHGKCVRAFHYHRSRIVDDSGVERQVDHMEQASVGLIMESGLMSIIDSVRLLKKACHHETESGFVVAYPVLAARELCGYFVFERHQGPNPVEDAIIQGVLEVFSNYFALLDESQRDHLTGLRNRQAMEAYFNSIWSLMPQTRKFELTVNDRRQGSEQGFWLAVIDVDHFKRINDGYGHIIGDEILLLISRLLQSSMRANDEVFRFGGEEFVALIESNDVNSADSMLERIRQRVEMHAFPKVGQVTISIGYCRAHSGLLHEEVLGNADRALYYAKSEGRNQIQCYEKLLSDGYFKVHDYGEAELF